MSGRNGQIAIGLISTAVLAAVSGGIGGLSGAQLLGFVALNVGVAGLAILAGELLRKELPDETEVSTGRIEDIQLTNFSRTARVPVVYGYRRVGGNVIQMGNAEYKDVTVTSTGRNESHLFADLLLAVSEGTCREVIAFYIEDTPQPVGTWRFQRGTPLDMAIPEFADLVDRNLRYPNTAKVFFAGDLGAVSNIPNFAIDLRGIYPSVIVEGTLAVTWVPATATLDGPTNTLLIVPTSASVASPRGVVTYRIPFENAPPSVVYTQPPSSVTTNISVAFYFGFLDAIVMQDPVNPRMWHFGKPGLARDSDEWVTEDFGPAFEGSVRGMSRDDRTCRIFALHEHADGTLYFTSLSIVSRDREQTVLTDGGFTGIEAFHVSVEDNAFYVVATGNGPDRVLKYDRTTNAWSKIVEITATDVVGVIKLGVMLYVFYPNGAAEVDIAGGTVINGISLTDFMSEDDADALGEGLLCTHVAMSRHRFSGVAIFTDADATTWRISCFHEPRSAGDSFPSPQPFRRWCVSNASTGRYIAKEGWPADPPINQVVWVSNGPVQAAESVADMVADGADYKTVATGTGLTTDLRPASTVSSLFATAVGAATLHEALQTYDDSTSYVELTAVPSSYPSYPGAVGEAIVALDPGDDPGTNAGHRIRFRYYFATKGLFGSGGQWSPRGYSGLRVTLMQGAFTTIAVTSYVYNVEFGLWREAVVNLTPTQAALITDYTDLRIKIELQHFPTNPGLPYPPAPAGLSVARVTCANLETISVVESLDTGLSAISYFPVHRNQQGGRRVIFYKSVTGGLRWWFTVQGSAACGDRDFEHFEIEFPGLNLTNLSSIWTTVDDPTKFVSGFDGAIIFFAAADRAVVSSYDHTSGFIVHAPISSPPGPYVNIPVEKTRWTGKHWSLLTPTKLTIDNEVGESPVPDFLLEGHYIGLGWFLAEDLDEIVEALRDNGWPEEPRISIARELHEGTYALSGIVYANQIYSVPDGGHVLTTVGSLPPDMPLKQYRLDTAAWPEIVYNTAAALGEAAVPGLMLEFNQHQHDGLGSNPVLCSSESPLFRDVRGIDENGTEHVVATMASVASWDTFRYVMVIDEKAKHVEIMVTPSGFRHDWFEGRTTPASIRVDMLMNKRYGVGETSREIDVASHLSLHGWSLTRVHIDGVAIRRFIWNYVAAQGTLASFDEDVLSPAGAAPITLEGRYSVAFDAPGIEPIMEIDASLITPGTFSIQVSSPDSGPNRIEARFYNAVDQRDDLADPDDEFNQEQTGSVRSKNIALDCVTDLRRAYYICLAELERSKSGRMGVSCVVSSVLRMILNPGDIVLITDPNGVFRRKPFRIVSLEDSGDGCSIEAIEVAPYTLDLRPIVGVRDTEADITLNSQAAQRLGSPVLRSVNIERFHGVSMMPVRAVAVVKDDGRVLLLANRPPQSREVMGVRARIVSGNPGLMDPTVGTNQANLYDDLPVTQPKSVAITDDILETEGEYAFDALIDTAERVQFPATGYLVKNSSRDGSSVVQEVTITAMAGGDVRDPGEAGTVSIEREAGMADMDHEILAADRVYTCTAEDEAEPVRYDGETASPQVWDDPGVWSDVTATLAANGPVAVFGLNKDFLVVGISGDGGWLPNALEITVDSAAAADQRLVFEYSTQDPRSTLQLWRPLSAMDGTKGLTQSGRIVFEIPPVWVKTASWDIHQNRVGKSLEKLYWIRIQRREKSGTGAVITALNVQNSPILVLEPLSPATVLLPDESQGQTAVFRFIGRSTMADDEEAFLPARTVVSTGARYTILPVAYPRLEEPSVIEFEDGDNLAPVDEIDYVFGWDHASASHGFDSTAFGGTIVGVQVDPHLAGVHVAIRRQSDGEVLREVALPYPIDRWTYTWTDRYADGNVPVAVEFRQYDDRGFYSDPVSINLADESYGYNQPPVTTVDEYAWTTDGCAATLIGLGGSSQVFSVGHNLGASDVVVGVYDQATGDEIIPDIRVDDVNNITVTFTPAPGAGDRYRIIISR